MNFSRPIKELTSDQLLALSANPNTVIKGAAGTGKTMFCILKARQLCEKGASVAIIISTIALKRFIQKAINDLQIVNCSVYHQYEWFTKSENSFDFILIDEVQDFSLKLVKRIMELSKKGVYLLGDSSQQIFDKTFYDSTTTIPVEEMAAQLNFPIIEMKKSVRIKKS